MTEVKLECYPTPEVILCAYWDLDPNCPVQESAEFGGLDDTGKEVTFTWEEQVDGVKVGGYWGWVRAGQETVHLWAETGVSDDDLLFLIGHELGHLIEDAPLLEIPAGMPPHVAQEFRREEQADRCGWVAAEAARLLTLFRKQEGERCQTAGTG